MDIEQKQAELIDQFVKQASALGGSALASVVADATSHPSLFAFSEILAVPSVLEVRTMAFFFSIFIIIICFLRVPFGLLLWSLWEFVKL